MMRPSPLAPLALLTCLSLFAFAGAAFSQSEDKPATEKTEVERLRAENARLRARIAELERQLATLRQEKQQIAAEKQQMQQQAEAEESEQRDYYLDRQYDADADRTTITTRVGGLRTERGGQWRRHWLHLEAEREGETGKPRHIHFNIETFATGKIYDRIEAITLTAGQTRVEAEVVEYDNQIRTTGSPKNRRRSDDETLVAAITLDELRQLAAASEVTGRMGTRTFQLSRDHVRALRALLGELTDPN